jgi:hypothetical protein
MAKNKTVKKVINWGAILVGLFFTLFILIGFFHNKANNRFPVYLAEQYERPGYEPYPAEAKVVMSQSSFQPMCLRSRLSWDLFSLPGYG